MTFLPQDDKIRYQIPRIIPHTDYRWLGSVDNYINSYDFWHDGVTEEIEQMFCDYTGRKHALLVNSATNGMFMCLYVAKYYKGLNDGKDEALIPNYAYPAAWKVCKLLNVKPIPVECRIDTLTIDSSSALSQINDRTIAIFYVENNGVIGEDIEVLENIADDVMLIEDSAPSMLQEYKSRKAGTFGDVSVYSFSPTKPLIAGEGGVLLTDDTSIYEALKELRLTDWKDYNDTSLVSMNCSLSPFLAAYIKPQMSKKNLKFLADGRKRTHESYAKLINIFKQENVTNHYGTVQYLSKNAKEIAEALVKCGVGHRYKYYPLYDENFPVSKQIREQLIDLPMHPMLSTIDIVRICKVIKEVENGN